MQPYGWYGCLHRAEDEYNGLDDYTGKVWGGKEAATGIAGQR